MKRSTIIALVAGLSVSGCGAYTPDVGQAADANGGTIADFSNSMLLTNIIRASNRYPVNYADLTAISETNSVQASAGFSFPFGALHGTSARDTATPNVQFSSSPTMNIGSLNNTGFEVAMLTPINPQYLVAKWNNEESLASRKVLLYALIKAIEFPDRTDKTNSRFKVVLNDPAAIDGLFEKIVNVLLMGRAAASSAGAATAAQIFPRAVSVMEPIGQAFKLAAATSQIGGLSFATGLGDGQFHVGNGATSADGQLYRVYPTQVVFCTPNLVSADEMAYPLPSKPADAAHIIPVPPRQDFLLFNDTLSAQAHANVMKGSGGGGANAGATGTGSSTASPAPTGSAPTAASAASQLTQALSSVRISALVPMEGCEQDEVVMTKPQSEKTFAEKSGQFVHIEWRSPSDVIAYLGALMRSKATIGGDSFSISRDKPTDDKSNLKIVVDHNDYYLNGDATLEAFALATDVVNLSKLAAGTQIPQPVLFVP